MSKKIALYILPAFLVFSSCRESETAKREHEIEHAKRLADIEVEKAKALANFRIEEERNSEQRRRQQEEALKSELRIQQAAEANRFQDTKIKLVKDLTFTTRTSLLDENDKVLQIRNPNPESVDIYLKCSTASGYTKTIFVSVQALKTAEVGILEGWNFRNGEKFQVFYNDSVYHTYNIN